MKDSLKDHMTARVNDKVVYDNETLQTFIEDFIKNQAKRDRIQKIIVALVAFLVVMNTIVNLGFVYALWRVDENNLLNQNLQGLAVCREYGFIKTGMVLPG